MTNETLDQLARETFQTLCDASPLGTFGFAREYVQKFILGEELKLPLGSNREFDAYTAFEDAVDDLEFELVALDREGEAGAAIDELLELLHARREEIVMAAQEELADSRTR